MQPWQHACGWGWMGMFMCCICSSFTSCIFVTWEQLPWNEFRQNKQPAELAMVLLALKEKTQQADISYLQRTMYTHNFNAIP
jgi:hypothetical protein